MTDYSSLTLGVENAVATITLNRPNVLNAVNPQVMDELRDALQSLKGLGARALILTGGSRAFCAGADLSGRGGGDGMAPEATRKSLLEHYNPGVLALNTLDMPVVTAVNGPAAGIGCSLALSGDFIIAGRSAYFLQAFVNIGFVPDGGSTWLLPRMVGMPKALKMMMDGDRLYGPEAEQIGLISYCVEDDQVMAKANAIAAKLATGPTAALAMIRQLVRGAQHMTLNEAMTHEAEAQKRALETSDAVEGVQAFLEKRPAAFKGK